MTRLLLGGLTLGLLVLAGGLAIASSVPRLTADGPTSLDAPQASTEFRVGLRTVRQVRYAEGSTLAYTFRLTNRGPLPLDVLGLSEDQPATQALTLRSLRSQGRTPVHLGVGDSARFTLRMTMFGCPTGLTRAAASVDRVWLRTRQIGLFGDDVLVELPDELRTRPPGRSACTTSEPTHD